MSSIEKLSIRGIRSFSPNRDEVLEFYHPLTVIVGANGCGKTTIIECLKCSCTGLLPPGSKSGQNFIHDPKISGITEVKACIRLRFRNRGQQATVVQRSFQLQQLKTTLKYKALDGVIRVVNSQGEKVSMSHKCGELDKLVPELLGVSRAILENVIFCHQEDSNWPLQEGAVLKKKFDDIFESSRYTKAIDSLRKIRLEKANVSKDLKRDLDVLQIQVNTADELKKKVEQLSEKLALMNENREDLLNQSKVCQSKVNEVETQQKIIKTLKDQAEKYIVLRDEKQKNMQVLRENMQVHMDIPDEELTDRLENFDVQAIENSSSLDELLQQESQFLVKKEQLEHEYTQLLVQKGKLEGDLKGQNTLFNELNEISHRLNLKYKHLSTTPFQNSSNNNQVDIENYHKLSEKLQEMMNLEKEKLQNVKSDHRLQDDQLCSILNGLHGKKMHLEEKKSNFTLELTETIEKKKHITEILMKRNSMSTSWNGLLRDMEMVDEKIKEGTLQIEKENFSLKLKDLRTQIDQWNEKQYTITNQKKLVEERIKILRIHQREQFTLENRRRELQEKQEKMEEKMEEFKSSFELVLQRLPSVDGLEKDVVEVKNKIDLQIQLKDQAVQELRSVQDEISKLTASLDIQHHDLEKALEEKKFLEETKKIHEMKQMIQMILSSSSSSSSFSSSSKSKSSKSSKNSNSMNSENEEDKTTTNLGGDVAKKTLDEDYSRAKNSRIVAENTVTFITKYMKAGLEKGRCSLCERCFDEQKAEQENYQELLTRKVNDVHLQDKIRKRQEREEKALHLCKKFDSMLGSWNRWVQLEKEIPQKHIKIKELDALKQQLSKELQIKQQAYEKVEEHLTYARELNVNLANLMESNLSIESLRARITDDEDHFATLQIEEQASSSSYPTTTTHRETLEQAELKVAQLQDELDECSFTCQRKLKESQRLAEFEQRLQANLAFSKQEKLKLQSSLDDYEKNKLEKENLAEKDKHLREQIGKINTDLKEINHQLQENNQQRETQTKKYTAIEDEMLFQFTLFQQDINDFQSLYDKVKNSLLLDLEDHFKRLEKRIYQEEMAKKNINEMLSGLVPKISESRLTLEKQNTVRRQLRENLQLRESQAALRTISEEVDRCLAQSNDFPSYESLQKIHESTSSQLRKIKNDISNQEGRREQVEEQLHDLRVQLQGQELKNINEKHRQKLIQHETTCMAVTDIEKYSKALDQAMMDYHSKKITEINNIIRELWQATYRGQDIDTIEIISGEEEGSRAKRSYNYRISMKKGDAELEMRGRCSAGQKVLAGLVIRLALAETFCVNCGILALDEPTTNLDSENKIGLANAINEIISRRGNQRNFQLICITHDEEFVQMLGHGQMLDGGNPGYYWRVSREELAPNQFYSTIVRQGWNDE